MQSYRGGRRLHFFGLWLEQGSGARAAEPLEPEGPVDCGRERGGNPGLPSCACWVALSFSARRAEPRASRAGVPPDRHRPSSADWTARRPAKTAPCSRPRIGSARRARDLAEGGSKRGRLPLGVGSAFPRFKMPKKKPTPIQLNPAPDGSAVNGTSSAE